MNGNESRFRDLVPYALVTDPPPPLGWDDYKSYLVKEFSLLLDRAEGEPPIQDFLERHPCLLPGGEGGGDSAGGHHGYVGGGVYARPRLGGTFSREPDFVWVTMNSGEIIPLLVEIEDPSKTWFRENGQESATLTQARTQLSEWQLWFEEGVNKDVFCKRFEVESYRRSRDMRTVHARFILIYGRRGEATANPHANAMRVINERRGTVSMSFDRLTPNEGSRNAVTLRNRYPARPQVRHVPPTLRLGPWMAGTLGRVDGWAEAIGRNEMLTQERKQFLIDRVPYWIAWYAENGARGAHPADAWE